jgi:hypothetical protein
VDLLGRRRTMILMMRRNAMLKAISIPGSGEVTENEQVET